MRLLWTYFLTSNQVNSILRASFIIPQTLMMNILKDLVRRMNTFTIFDYASYEIVVFTMGLLLAKLLPFLVQGNTWLYIVIIAI
jgi:hypothetical protein